MNRTMNREVWVAANLPYLPDSFKGDPGLTYEPSLALYAGQDGLAVYRAFAREVERLKPKRIFMELFEEQIQLLLKELPHYTLKETVALSGRARLITLELTE